MITCDVSIIYNNQRKLDKVADLSLDESIELDTLLGKIYIQAQEVC